MEIAVEEIELNENNLYRNGTHYVFSNKEELLLRKKLVITGDLRDQYYTVKKFDRIDLIAYKFYNNVVDDSSKFWWIIADANEIQNPLDLTDFIGKQILIPNIANVLLIID